jgi:hypothetical protein
MSPNTYRNPAIYNGFHSAVKSVGWSCGWSIWLVGERAFGSSEVVIGVLEDRHFRRRAGVEG